MLAPLIARAYSDKYRATVARQRESKEMAITLPIIKTLKRAQPSALLWKLEEMRLHAEKRCEQTKAIGRDDLAEYWAGQNDALIDAMEAIRESQSGGE